MWVSWRSSFIIVHFTKRISLSVAAQLVLWSECKAAALYPRSLEKPEIYENLVDLRDAFSNIK